MHPSSLGSTILHLGRRRCRLPRFGAIFQAPTEENRRISLTKPMQFSTFENLEHRFAAVNHSTAYEAAMKGRHGQQLALAKLEGVGRDDKPFDPFLEMEKRKNAESGNMDNSVDEMEGEDDEDGEDEGQGFMPSIYNNDGSPRRSNSQLAILRAGYPAGGLFAIVHVNGFQHKVAVHDILVVDRLKPLDTWGVGSTHTLTEILLIGSSHLTLVGMPLVTGAEVDVMVEEITRDAKVIVFKKRRRKNSKRKNGFRRDVTVLRILDVRMPEPYSDHRHIEPEIELRPLESKRNTID